MADNTGPAVIGKRYSKGGGIVKAKKTAPKKIQWAGNVISANQWFKIGVTRAEARMLKAVSDEFENKPKSAQVARFLLHVAMAHYHELKPLFVRDADYMDAEGFYPDQYYPGVIAAQHAKLIRARP